MSFGLNEKLLIHIPAAPPDGWLEAVAALFPALEVRWEVAEFVGSGIVASADVLPAEAWEGVTMLCVYPPVSQTHMANVRFVQLVSAGSDLWLGQPSYLDPGIQFCSASGAHPYALFPSCFVFCTLHLFVVSASLAAGTWQF
jgi:hypothetical protein